MSDVSDVKRYELPLHSPKTVLHGRVVKALHSIPMRFKSPINIEGLLATDLFQVNSMLGGAIEDQTVAALNEVRTIWDPDNEYADYEFKRYPESFPDVRLESNSSKDPLMGIELKGWFLLAKEGEPSFRFKASADAMTIWDLLVVYPWSLSNVLSGTPILSSPFIDQAKYVADLRTYYWEHRSEDAQPVEHPKTHPYPDSRSKYSDVVHDDTGGNFGRIARVKLMDAWVKETLQTPLAGIEAKWWVDFLKLFKEGKDEKVIRKRFERIAKEVGYDSEWADEVVAHVTRLMNIT